MVRASTDRGLTWSEAGVVAEPDPSNLYLYCALADPAAYYDPETETWHLLSNNSFCIFISLFYLFIYLF